MVLSMSLSIPFMFDSINSLVTTQIYNATNNVSDPYLVSAGVCGLSVSCALVIYFIYIRSKNVKSEDKRQSLLSH